MFSKVEKTPTASIFQKHLSFEGRWQGGLRCTEHLAEGERFPRLHAGTKIFLQRHGNRWIPTPQLLVQKCTVVSLNWEIDLLLKK